MVDLGPRGSRELTDPDGRRWVLRRRRLDPRTARSLMRHTDVPVLVERDCGGGLRWMAEAERAAFTAEVRRCYALPLDESDCATQYVAHELVDDAGRRMVYVETHC